MLLKSNTFINYLDTSFLRLFTAINLFFICTGVFSQGNLIRLEMSGPVGFNLAGYYVAQEKGFYQDAGIRIELIVSFLTPDQVINNVITHKSDFAIGNSSLALAALQKKPIVVVANIFQRSAAVMITTPDFGNQLFMASNNNISFPSLIEAPEIFALLTSQGYAVSEIVKIQSKNNDLIEFITRKNSAIYSLMYRDPIILEDKKVAFKIIDPEKYGIHFYGDVLFGNQQWVEKNYDLTKRFTEATIRGWKYALSNPDESIEILRKESSSSIGIPFLKAQAKVINELMMPEKIEIGSINSDRWNLIADFFNSINISEPNTRLPTNFLFSNWQQAINDRYEFILEIVIFLLILVVLIALILFYFKLRRLEKSVKEKELLMKLAQEKANLDPLTGLPNRRLLIERLRIAIALHEEESNQSFALFFFDIDDFKKINDQFGHSVGDDILIQLSNRIKQFIKPTETLARQGGDEFVLLIQDICSNDDVISKLDQLRSIIEKPLFCSDQTFRISASFGYAIYKSDSDSIEDLLKVADSRMYREKFRNLNNIRE